MIRWLKNLIVLQEKREFHGETVVFFAVFVGCMRLLLEIFLVGYQNVDTYRDVIIYVSWYFMCFFVFGLPVRIFAPAPWQKRINVMLVGLFLGFMPPVIDVLIEGWGNVIVSVDNFYYAYIKNFPEGWPWLMIDPARRMPVGEGAILWSAVFFTGTYLWIRTKSAWRAILGMGLSYVVCMFVGAIFPTMAFHARKSLWPNASLASVVIFGQVLIAVLVYFVVYRPSLALFVGGRFIHAMPLLGMALVGYAWIKPIDVHVLEVLVIVSLCGIVTIMENDHWDDAEEFPGREPRVFHYDIVVIRCAWMIVLAALLYSGSSLAIVMMIYGVASYLYNAPLYRGKRYFPANLKLEGLWGGLAFLFGCFAAAFPELARMGERDLAMGGRLKPWMREMPFSWGYDGDVAIAALLAFGGWSVLASLKDEKDVEMDTRMKSQTVFTLAARRGVPPEKVSWWVRAVAFACMLFAAWGPLAIGRSSLPHALLVTVLGVGIVAIRWRDKKNEFRMILGLLTLLLAVLGHGLSVDHDL